MTFQQHSATLDGDTPGQSTQLYWYTAGPDDAPTKVYLQAALHADEQPGTMLLHHLLPMLRQLDGEEKLNARFVIFPSVNPLGLGTNVLRRHIGRYDLETGVNFNRRWPDLYPQIADAIAGKFTSDASQNIGVIRNAVRDWLDSQQPVSATQKMRLIAMRAAHDADMVLDLHCDDESLIHIFTSPEMIPGLDDLAAHMGADATLTAEDSGGGSFDEVLPVLFRKAQKANPAHPIPMRVETATLEYRGRADISDNLGRDDAQRLFNFLAGRGLVDAPTTSPEPAPKATPFEATEVLRADRSGLLAYRVGLGDHVRAGDVVADIIAMDGPEAFLARSPLRAGTDGLILSRSSAKLVRPGSSVAKIVGSTVLPARSGGYLLED